MVDDAVEDGARYGREWSFMVQILLLKQQDQRLRIICVLAQQLRSALPIMG